MSRRWAVTVGILFLLPAPALAQGVPTRPPVMQGQGRERVRPDTGRLAADSTRRDSLGAVQWQPSDSVMRALSARKGYTVTRYQGGVLTFDALRQAIQIIAGEEKHAAVQRGDQMVVTDSAITYDSQTRGLRVVSRDTAGAGYVISPGGGQAPIAGRTTATYNLTDRSGRVNDASLSVVNDGNTWFVNPKVVKIEAGDSTRNIPPRLYGTTATLTSCDDSILPDYHFEVGEVKRTKNLMVGRPAVLYIGTVPVMWMPFFFQDIRSGRRSGMLTPRVGVADVIRNSPTFRRDIENLGWYWALNDYMDASTWLDWRSSLGGSTVGDPGWLRFNGQWSYNWRDRFLSGHAAAAYTQQRNGQTNLAINWNHSQKFSKNSSLTANVNYVTSTQLQRQNTIDPYAALQTISSAITYTDRIGPATFSVGGTRKQYLGRDQVDQTVPTVSVSTTPIELSSWLNWTPGFKYSASQTLHSDQPGLFSQRYSLGSGGLDSSKVDQSSYVTTLSFDSPLQIFGWSLRNSFTINDQQNDFPQQFLIYPIPGDTSVRENRVFASTYRTQVDWTPSFSLPSLGDNVLHLSPSVGLSNVDPGPFWVRTERTGGQFVHQSKRPSFGLSMAPTLYGLFPGFGPVARFRHTFSPTIGFTYAPPGRVSDEYLAATGQRSVGYLGALAQKSLSFSLHQTLEAKMRQQEDTLNGGSSSAAQPIQILSLDISPLNYDFERAAKTGRAISGITNSNFTYQLSSALLPGFSLSVGYSLFQGNNLSDTAVFKPFRNSVSASFSMSHDRNPFAFLLRALGISRDSSSSLVAKAGQPVADDQQLAEQSANRPVAGMGARDVRYLSAPAKSWSATFNFSAARERPPVGGTVIEADPTRYCLPYKDPTSPSYQPLAYDLCVQQQSTSPTQDAQIPSTASGGAILLNPPTASLGSNVQFPLTPKWSVAWRTMYNFQQHEFASQDVQLIRELHDWRATFSFTQSPNGNFAFSFQISLIAEPDLKFNYDKGTYRSAGGT